MTWRWLAARSRTSARPCITGQMLKGEPRPKASGSGTTKRSRVRRLAGLRAIQRRESDASRVCGWLLFYNLFNVSDFLLNFAADFFALSFGFEVRIVSSVSQFLFDCAFDFVRRAFNLVFGTVFHGLYSFA